MRKAVGGTIDPLSKCQAKALKAMVAASEERITLAGVLQALLDAGCEVGVRAVFYMEWEASIQYDDLGIYWEYKAQTLEALRLWLEGALESIGRAKERRVEAS